MKRKYFQNYSNPKNLYGDKEINKNKEIENIKENIKF